MGVHFVFVRFYFEGVPLPQITHLRDEDLGSALEGLRKQWWASPENQRVYERRQEELRKQTEVWNAGALAMPGVNQPSIARRLFGNDKRTEKEPTLNENFFTPGCGGSDKTNRNPLPAAESEEPVEKEPSLTEIFSNAGWGDPSNITKRYPVALFESKEQAEIVCDALQRKAQQLRDASLAKSPYQPSLFEMANPHFAAIAETDLTPSERIGVLEQIERLSQPKGKNASREEAFVRVYIPELRRILDLSNSTAHLDSNRQGFVDSPAEQ